MHVRAIPKFSDQTNTVVKAAAVKLSEIALGNHNLYKISRDIRFEKTS